MTLLQSVPDLKSGEALTGYVSRLASNNELLTSEVLARINAADLYSRRVATWEGLHALQGLTGIRARTLADATLDRYPDAVIGRPDITYQHADPMGWVTPAFSAYCPTCLQDGSGWRLEHQTALAMTCPTHGGFLRTTCGSCSTQDSMTRRASRGCRHHRQGSSVTGATEPSEEAERTLLRALATARGSSDQVAGLRRIRAATALVWIDALSGNSQEPMTRHLRELVDSHGPGLCGGGRWASRRLVRPPGEPWINAQLLNATWPHVDPATLTLEPAWLTHLRSIGESRPRAQRADVFLEELGIGTRVPRRSLPIHDDWLRMAVRGVTERPSEMTSLEVPPCLWAPDEDPFGRWLEAAARAILYHHVATATVYTDSVSTLGHLQSVTTKTRAILTNAPTPSQERAFEAAMAAFHAAGGVHGEDGRRAQGQIGSVAPTVLRRMLRPLPQHPRATPGQMGALWLWVMTTHGPMGTAPFLDGRSARSAASPLRQWAEAASADDKLTLLDWNNSQLAKLGVPTAARLLTYAAAG